MPRHPENTNLHLHYESSYELLPLMADKGPFVTEYLSRLKQVIDLSLKQYPRVLAFRVDLRLPLDMERSDWAYTNEIISKFIESFKAKIANHRARAREQNRYAHDCKVRYVWAREIGQEGRPHYHLLILLNQEAYYTVGRLGSKLPNVFNRLEAAWASALGRSVGKVSGLVNLSQNGEYRISRVIRDGQTDLFQELFYRASYLCKAATKSYGDRQRSFDTSRG